MSVLQNANWEAYAVARVKGLSQRQAYREAYPNSRSKDETVDNKACNLEKKGEVKARIKELKGEVASAAVGEVVLSRTEKRAILAEMARDKTLSVNDRQRAIDLDNKMEDEYKTILDGNVGLTKLEELL